jgi:hypothetical protein
MISSIARARWTALGSRWFTEEALAPMLLLVGLGALVCLTPAQNDTWWHLRSGREMWETGSLLTTERFSHTAFGADLRNYWWISQLAFFALYAMGGPVLLTLAAGACAYAAVFGSWRLMRGSWEVRLVLLIFLILATAPEWAVRPQVISLALLVLTAHALTRDRVGWLPLLFVVWANAHPQVVLGVALTGAAALEALVWSRTRVKRDMWTAVCCAAAPMASPDGWRFWLEAIQTVSVSRAVQLQEYRPPIDAGSLPFWIAVGVLAVMVFLKRGSIANWDRADRVLTIAAVLLAAASVGAARNIAFFAVIAAPALSRILSSRNAVPARASAPAGVGAYVMVAVAVVAAAVAVRVGWQDGGVRLGWRPLSDSIVNAVRLCPGRMFNHLADGGYLMWALPSRPVFVDSRMNAYPVALLQRSRDADLNGVYSDLFRQYGIGCAVVSTESPLRQRLAGDPSMTPVYADAAHAVFQRAGVMASMTASGGERDLWFDPDLEVP